MSNTKLRLHPIPSMETDLEDSSPRGLLQRLKTRIKVRLKTNVLVEDLSTHLIVQQDAGEEYRQVLYDIYDMTDGALKQAESELEDDSIAQMDGVLVQTFIPFMTKYVHHPSSKYDLGSHSLSVFYIRQLNMSRMVLLLRVCETPSAVHLCSVSGVRNY